MYTSDIYVPVIIVVASQPCRTVAPDSRNEILKLLSEQRNQLSEQREQLAEQGKLLEHLKQNIETITTRL